MSMYYEKKLPLVMIRGAGDLASGVANRLYKSGFPVIMLEAPQPTVIRRTVAYASAIFEGITTIEGVTACKAESSSSVHAVIDQGRIPVLIDPAGESILLIKPKILVDAIMAKKNLGTSRHQAPLVIALGPGFTAGRDVDAVVETMRGHYLGRVTWHGAAIPDTGSPGDIAGFSRKRLLRAPEAGIWNPLVNIGDMVREGDTVAMVGTTPVKASLDGIVRGLLYPGLAVHAGMKVGDIDPRADVNHCFTISDKARAVAGGVLEAVMHGLFAREDG